jgi:hypothetical protein
MGFEVARVDEQEASQPLLELAGLAEIASMLGVSKQRVQELAARDGLFPLPVARVSGGTLYKKSMIEAFNTHWMRTPGRPVSHQAQVSDELTHIPKDRQDQSQQSLRMIYNNIRLHDLKVDPSTPAGQSLFLAIKQTPGQPGFEPRYDTGFFEVEPPDKRYKILHAECGTEHDSSLWEAARATGGDDRA